MTTKRDAENERRQKKGSHFSNIKKDGFFMIRLLILPKLKWPLDRTSFVYCRVAQNQTIVLSAKKSTAISKKAMALKTNIPVQFDVPQIKVESQY
jgi:hypothetical protein